MKQWLVRLNARRIRGSVPGAGDVAVQRWVTVFLAIMRAYEFYVTTLPVRAELGRVRLAGADTGVEKHVTAELGYKQSTGCSIFNIHQRCVCIPRSRIAAL